MVVNPNPNVKALATDMVVHAAAEAAEAERQAAGKDIEKNTKESDENTKSRKARKRK